MNWNRIRGIIKKDLREVTVNSMVVVPMIIVPVLLCIVIPAVVLVVFMKLDINLMTGLELIEKIVPMYAVPEGFTGLTEKIAYVFFNYTFLPFFMIIPVMVSSIIASNAVVGEKERKTLETLLYTPITNREFLAGKLLSSFIPAVLVSFATFIGYFTASNLIFNAFTHMLLIRTLIWIPAVLLLAPAVSLLGLSITLIVSLRAKTFMEAQQLSGVVVVPFLALIFIQLTGLVVFTPLYVIGFSIVLILISYVIIAKIGPKFDRERIISTV
mgnify:FL=1